MLQACLNGARSRRDHPKIPLTPEELAEDAARVVAAGAAELHVHPRNAEGSETLDPDDTARALEAIRTKAPGVPVGLTTREGIRTDAGRGFEQMKAWRVLPDYVSVNLAETDAPAIMALMREKGIGIEAGLATVADARRFAALPAAEACLRILIEIDFEEDAAKAAGLADDILRVLADDTVALPLLLHGFDSSVWPLYRKSLELGIDARLGFEDGLRLPDGRVAADNRAIILAARGLGPSPAKSR
ncbi:MAG: 3-keto-5-aminohexanoate cleavage protein [Parvibaculaceae bacterium]